MAIRLLITAVGIVLTICPPFFGGPLFAVVMMTASEANLDRKCWWLGD